mmetsp:Transcript_4001/g.8797  ORF Transcript_4001/g.8797 Transcript_4001/m.8797 type:complete len:93 (-) Transcript_4001:2472-2750(-)
MGMGGTVEWTGHNTSPQDGNLGWCRMGRLGGIHQHKDKHKVVEVNSATEGVRIRLDNMNHTMALTWRADKPSQLRTGCHVHTRHLCMRRIHT